MLDSESTMGTVFVVKKYSKKGICKCTHYNGDNRVMETCFKLHGYPNWHPKGKTTSNTKVDATSKSHISTAVGFVTKSDISNSALNIFVVTRGSEWIIDSSTTNHMTCDPHKFTNFSLNCSKTFIIYFYPH